MGFRNPVTSLRADQIAPGKLPAGVELPDQSVTPVTIAVGAITPPALAPEAVTGPAIAAGAVTADAIAANAVTAAAIAAGEVTAVHLAANAVTADAIAANAITAAAIAATAIDGKTITGATIRTAASGQRVQLTTGGLTAYNAGGTAVTTISATTGVLSATGATLSSVTVSGTISGTLNTGDDIGGWHVQVAAAIVSIEKASVIGLRMMHNQLDSDGDITIQSLGEINVLAAGEIYFGASGDIGLAGANIVSTTVRDATLATGGFAGPVGVTSAGRLGRITGTLAVAQIPDLAASKITSGTLDAARVPNLDAAKITTGVLSVDRVPNLNGNATAVRIYPGTNPDGAVYNVRVTSTPNMGFYDGGTAKLYVNSDGNVLAPQVYSYSTSTRAVYVNSSGGLGTTSSLRAHKCAIADVDAGVIDALLALRPVTFLRVADPDGRREVGLIAEDAVAAGMPTEFLYLSDDGALEGLAYERLPVYLLTAVQHLHARLTHLEGAAA